MQFHDVSPLIEQCLQKKSLQIKTGMKFHIKRFAFFCRIISDLNILRFYHTKLREITIVMVVDYIWFLDTSSIVNFLTNFAWLKLYTSKCISVMLDLIWQIINETF